MLFGHEATSKTSANPPPIVLGFGASKKEMEGFKEHTGYKRTSHCLQLHTKECHCLFDTKMVEFGSPGLPTMGSTPRMRRRSGWFWTSLVLASALLVFASSKVSYSSLSLNQLHGVLSRTWHSSDALEVRTQDEADEVTQLPQLARTDQVQFDNYSLILRGQRIFLQYIYFFTSEIDALLTYMPLVLENSIPLGYLYPLCGQIFSRR